MTNTSTKKEKTEREYFTELCDVKEAITAAIKGKRDYVTFMVAMYPKYADKKGKALLRRVFNGQKRDESVLSDFKSLPGKIAQLQNA